MATLAVKVPVEVSGLTQLDSLGSKLRSIGTALTTSITLPIAAIGAAITKVGVEFDTTLRQINALTDVTAGEIDGVRQAILQLASQTGRAPAELAQGFYFLASAGLTTKQAMDTLTIAAQGSAAGLGATDDIAKILAATLNAYGTENITAAQAADILVAAVKDGTAEADAFAGVLGRVVPTAATLGVSFDQVTAALAAMTLTGLSADEAATSLNQVLVSLLNPSAEAEKALKAMGTSSAELRKELAEKGLLATLRDLETRFNGNDEAVSAVFGNVRALRGVLALLGLDSSQLTGIFEDTATATGSLGQAFSDTDGPGRDLQKTSAAIQATLIELSTTVLPAVQSALAKVRDGLAQAQKWWTGLDDATRSAIVTFAGLAAIVGPVILALGMIIGAVTKIGSAIALVIAPISSLVSFFVLVAAQAGPLTAIVLVLREIFTKANIVIAVLALAASVVAANWPTIVGIVQTVSAAVSSFAATLATALAPAISALQPVFDAIGAVLGFVADNFDIISVAVAALIGLLVGTIGPVLAVVAVVVALAAAWTRFGDQITAAVGAAVASVQSAFAAIAATVGQVTATITAAVTAGWTAITSAVTAALNAIYQVASAVWGAIRDVIRAVLTVILVAIVAGVTVWQATMGQVLGAIFSIVSSVWRQIYAVISSVLAQVGSVISSVWNTISTTIRSILTTISGVVSTVFSAINATVTSQVNATRATATSVWQAIQSAITTVVNAINAAISAAFNAASSTVRTVMSAIASTVSSLWSQVVSAFNSAQSAIAGALNAILRTFQTVFSGIASAVRGPLNTAIGFLNAFIRYWDSIRLSIPTIDLGPLGTIGGYTVSLPYISPVPYLAKGVRDFIGGLAVVGENGPELVNLPAGSDVYSRSDTAGIFDALQSGAMGGVTIVGQQITSQTIEAHAPDEVERQVQRGIRRAALAWSLQGG